VVRAGEHNAARTVKLKVEHRLGEVLAATVRHEGSRGVGDTVSHTLPKEITRKQSSRAQRLARVPWTEVQRRIDRETVRHEGGRPCKNADTVSAFIPDGISQQQSSRARQLARVPWAAR
jgi:hypothetical protein